MKSLSIAIALFALTACTNSVTPPPTLPSATPAPGEVLPSPTPVATPNIACSIQNSLTQAMALGIGSAADCTGTAAIQADLNKVASKLNICKATADGKKAANKGALGDIACPMLVSALGLAAMAQVPADYQCDGGVTRQILETKLTDLCKKNISI